MSQGAQRAWWCVMCSLIVKCHEHCAVVYLMLSMDILLFQPGVVWRKCYVLFLVLRQCVMLFSTGRSLPEVQCGIASVAEKPSSVMRRTYSRPFELELCVVAIGAIGVEQPLSGERIVLRRTDRGSVVGRRAV